MKKTLLLLLLLTFFSTVYAQRKVICVYPGKNSKNQSKVYFGFKAGTNISHLKINRGLVQEQQQDGGSWKAGFLIGGFLEVPFIKKFYAQPEYHYSLVRGNYGKDNNYSMSYFSLPILLKYKPNQRVAFLAGPQFELLIRSKAIRGGNEADVTNKTEARSIVVAAGIEYSLTRSLSIGARYLQGLNNVDVESATRNSFKYQTVQMTASYRIKSI